MPAPGRRPRLSPDLIATAAERVVAAHGITALTMRRVADEVGSTPMALYRHVPGRVGLLRLLLDRLTARLPRPDLPTDPSHRLLVLCQTMHDWLAPHPWAVELAARHLFGEPVLWLVERLLGALSDLGLRGERLIRGYETIWRYTLGELALHHGPGAADVAPAAADTVDLGDFPLIRAHLTWWQTLRGRDEYAEGLRIVLRGLLPPPPTDDR